MKFGVPWSVKGIRPEARETAKEAARRSGMSLADWLNEVIIHQAAHEGVDANALAQADDNDASVHQRLDELSQRIEQMTRAGQAMRGPAAYAPPHVRAAPPMAPTTSPVEQAAAEIAARQRMLNGHAPHARPAMSAQPPMPQQPHVPQMTARVPLPAQDLSGLEDQLRHITDQIETLRKPGVEEAINALRGELGEIANNLAQAMPLSAIDAIEKQIRGLTQRIAEGRQAGVDGGALSGIEHGLAEVRDALQHLTPAENLVGFNVAVETLAHKIDLIVAEKDPATLREFHDAVQTLRGVASHVASNETVSQLAAEVQRLADRVEHIAVSNGGDALGHLEQRISALSDAIEARAQQGGQVPPRLESLVSSLSDKIEQIQISRGDGVALGHLEDRIVTLVEKLDASDSRLGHLEAIERGLADLLVNVEEMRAGKGAGGVRAAPEVDVLKHDIARTQNALDQVHGTLGTVVDRLSAIEQNMRGGAQARPAIAEADPEEISLKQPIGKIAARLVSDAAAAPAALPPVPSIAPSIVPSPAPPQPATPAPAATAKRPPVPAANRPHDPDLPPDLPLEPGSGPPKLRANAGARIAASEAALGIAGTAAGGSKSNFINAARRAAQAAIADASPGVVRVEPPVAIDQPTTRASLKGRLLKRMKSMFVAASVIAVVIGSVQIASKYYDFGIGGHGQQAAQKTTLDTVAASDPDADSPDENDGATPANTGAVAANPPAALSGGIKAPATTLDLMNPAMLSAAPPPAAPAINPPLDITGSISRPAAADSRHAEPDKLPIAIGPAALRSAAMKGDGAAAYEIAVRFADGHGVSANLEEAARWFERAAGKGLAPAQFRLASQLEKGQGVKKDLAQARRLYLAAAAKGNAKAMHNLAVLYAEGIEGKPDYQVAAQWFRKAASRGIADSQFNLGILYARGLGVEKDFAESYKWFALAAARGDKDAAGKRDEVASRLEAREFSAAQHEVKIFVAEPQPEEAVSVAVPHGGWDRTSTGTPPAKPRPKLSGIYEVGKR